MAQGSAGWKNVFAGIDGQLYRYTLKLSCTNITVTSYLQSVTF